MNPTQTRTGAANSRYYTTAQAAERLHSAVRTLERWRQTGFGPAYVKLGKRVLYSEESLAAWEATRTFANTSAQSRALPLAA
jgi:hypothetical protein